MEQRQLPGLESECPDMTIPVPAVEFRGELVALDDGRLLGRIVERIQPVTEEDLQVDVTKEEYVAVPGARGVYTGEEVLCEHILEEAWDLYDAVTKAVAEEEEVLVETLIERGLNGLQW